MVTVAIELRRGISSMLTSRHLAASSGGILLVQAASCWLLHHCCTACVKLQNLCSPTGSPCRRLLWPHTLFSASAGDHSLVQGLKGDATYLVVTDAGEIEKYGINGVALHPIWGCSSACSVTWEMPWQRCFKRGF